MKSSKTSKAKPSAVAAPVEAPRRRLWPYAVGIAGALIIVFQVYWPVMTGPFLLDDSSLPYMNSAYAAAPLKAWLSGLRPALMFSYWLNFQHAGNQDTFAYHMVNVLLHLLNGGLIYLAVRKPLSWAKTDQWHTQALSIFAAGLFLLHPVQTESVSYIASRSETLSVFFVLAAFVVFLYRRTMSVGLGTTLAVLILFAAACLTKEHAAVFPVLLILTDYYWNPGFSVAGIRRNWKLYVPILMGAAVAVFFVLRVLKGASSAGFRMKDVTWYQYFFTECRVIWHYIRLYVVPVGQNVDYDFPFSRTVVDHGAIIGLIALLAVTVAAWIYRRRFVLASYGWFVFLILLAPTSSFVPISDPIAERRLYLPFIGLLLMTVDFLQRWKTGRTAFVTVLGVVLLAESAMTYQRNLLWSTSIDLWKDSVSKSPNKERSRFQLARAYYDAASCSNSVDEYQRAAQLQPPSFDLLVDWALALDCAGRPSEAVEKMIQAAAIEPNAHVYSQLGMEFAKLQKYPQALDALAKGIQIDPNFLGGILFVYRGNVYNLQGNNTQAAEEYRHALAIDPRNQFALDGLKRVGQ
jgi:protein O-mannosyl-transferase